MQIPNLTKNSHFCAPIIVNISIPPPLDPKISDIQRIFIKRSKCVWLQNWIGGWGVCKL